MIALSFCLYLLPYGSYWGEGTQSYYFAFIRFFLWPVRVFSLSDKIV